jgi:hypothetical protein
MCAEKIQRFLMAIVLTVALVLMAMGPGFIGYGVILQTFVILMVIVWAVTDFCPSIWLFKKLFGSCYDR